MGEWKGIVFLLQYLKVGRCTDNLQWINQGDEYWQMNMDVNETENWNQYGNKERVWKYEWDERTMTKMNLNGTGDSVTDRWFGSCQTWLPRFRLLPAKTSTCVPLVAIKPRSSLAHLAVRNKRNWQERKQTAPWCSATKLQCRCYSAITRQRRFSKRLWALWTNASVAGSCREYQSESVGPATGKRCGSAKCWGKWKLCTSFSCIIE